MQAVRESGKEIAVVSDIHFDIRDHFHRHDLDRFVDAYVLSFEHGIQKPDAAMFTLALDALNVTAERALMVGDTPTTDGGAAHVGIQTYLLPGPFRPGRAGPRGLDVVLRLAGISS
jgi:HAD superfamily hydrolase (TIGR01549 family)